MKRGLWKRERGSQRMDERKREIVRAEDFWGFPKGAEGSRRETEVGAKNK